MSVYSFKITKGKFQLSLTTTDQELVRDQFALWVRKSAEYVQKHKVQQCKEIVNSQISAEKEITQQKIDEQLKRMPKQEPIVNTDEHKTPDKELDIFYAPKKKDEFKTTVTPAEIERNEQYDNSSNNFDNILEKSIQAPQTELSFKPSPSIKKDNAFISFITARPLEKKLDYLLMTAYYFTQYEQKPRFTLKQLNAKLMQNFTIIVDHSILQSAIAREFITQIHQGNDDVSSEYMLTEKGVRSY